MAEYFGDTDGKLPPNLTPPPDWALGKEHNFLVLNITSGTMKTCTARIFLITDHIVFWLDTDESPYLSENLIGTLRNFDVLTLPILRRIFGTENDPGIDNDPRFHVVFTGKIGDEYNGYFSALDSEDPRLRPASNGKELMFLNSRLIEMGETDVLDTLAHEYQHMIHFHYDRNEQSFINEGLSGLVEYLTLGSIRDSFIRNYLSDTGKSLILWPDVGTAAPYYGSSFLFCTYLHERFGDEFIHELVSRTENGLNGIDAVLKREGISLTADDVFQQWTAALLGELLRLNTGEWGYQSYVFPQEGIYRDIRTLSCGSAELHETAQYGIRFYKSSCASPFRITVRGTPDSPVTSLAIPAGEHAWWSGAVNESMAILSHDFDLTAASLPVILKYDINFEIETDYDYYYLLLKDEEGRTTRLQTSTSTDHSPAQLNLGMGSTGNSGGTIHEEIDISPWAGQHVRISFVYLTDTAAVGDGLLIDNIAIDAIAFEDDAESDADDWEAIGFSRIRPTVSQDFSLVVLKPQNDGTAQAEFYTFAGGEYFSVNCPEGNCAFAVSPVNRNIRSRAAFSLITE